MKKLFKCFIAALLATVLVVTAMANPGVVMAAEDDKAASAVVETIKDYAASAKEQEAIALGFAPVLKNDKYTLFYKAESAEIAVYNRANDEVVYSNPQDIPEDVAGLAFHRLKSQIYLTYYVNNSQIKYYSSYFDSVSYGQNSAEIKDGKLIVNYVFGKATYTKAMLPIAIPKSKFEKEILPELSDEAKEIVTENYKLTSVDDAKTEIARKKLVEAYKNIEKTDLYVLDKYLPVYEVEDLYKALFTVYTAKDFVEDNGAAGGSTEIPETTISFDISLIYGLADDGLVVSLDCSKLQKSEAADIDSIAILECMGAGGPNDTGFSVIPDGSGGVINFNTNKTYAAAYTGKVFGTDNTLKYTGASVNERHIQLPMFGISKNNSGIVAVVEKGAEICSITADISDKILPYNYTAFRADVYQYDLMTIQNPQHGGGTLQMFVRQKEPYKDLVTIHYYFLENGKNSVSDIANLYRGLLIADGTLSNKVTGTMPFVFGLTGAITVRKQFLGIPYIGYETLTTFEQAEKVINYFDEAGINNMAVRYSGWFNGGLEQTDISKFKVLSCLGGKKGMDALISNSVAEIFPEVKIANISGKAFDGFSVRNDAARLTYNETALIYPLDLPRNSFDYNAKYTYLLSSAKYEQRINKFLKKYNYDNICLPDFMDQINSDYAKKNYTDRTAALANILKCIEIIEEDRKIMASQPNSYAFGDAAIMTDMPISTSGANIFDMDVPFLQMVLTGYADMTTAPINITDGEYDLLKLMSYNVLPNYNLIYESSSLLKNTDFSDNYSMCYEDWADDAIELYNAYIKDMQKVRGETMISWNSTAEGLVTIGYESGKVLVVNRTNKAANVGGVEIAAQTYKLFEEGLK